MKKRLGTGFLAFYFCMVIFGSCFAESSAGFITVSCPRHHDHLVCTNCGWEGNETAEVTCSICDGKRSMVCDKCGGTGKQQCMACGGTGKIFKTTKNCSLCHGTGKSACYYCDYGIIICWSCDGTGRKTEKIEKCPTCSTKNLVCLICRDMNEKKLQTRFTTTPDDFSYRNVMRSPDNRIGTYYAVNALVQFIEESAEGIYNIVLRQDENGISYQYELLYFAQPGAPKILKGDTIRAYGLFSSYDKNNKPAFIAGYMDILE